jgi:hypothetical protein
MCRCMVVCLCVVGAGAGAACRVVLVVWLHITMAHLLPVCSKQCVICAVAVCWFGARPPASAKVSQQAWPAATADQVRRCHVVGDLFTSGHCQQLLYNDIRCVKLRACLHTWVPLG